MFSFAKGDVMGGLPNYDDATKCCLHPAVIILGAGASIATVDDTPEKNDYKLPSMNDLVEVLGLNEKIRPFGVSYSGENFEDFYSDIVDKNDDLAECLETEIYDYFKKLKLPDAATIYDKLILGLRCKDVIASFNWDPFLAQAYMRNSQKIGSRFLPQIVFLHGNVMEYVCEPCKKTSLGPYHCPYCYEDLKPTKLLYPVKNKDYTQGWLKYQWTRLEQALDMAYLISFYGYSAPKTDIEARNLIYNALKNNAIREQHELEIIDIKVEKDPPDLEKNWEQFPFSHHYEMLTSILDSNILRFPRRSCEALYERLSLCEFLDDRPFENFKNETNLAKLQKIALGLIEEEQSGKLNTIKSYSPT